MAQMLSKANGGTMAYHSGLFPGQALNQPGSNQWPGLIRCKCENSKRGCPELLS